MINGKTVIFNILCLKAWPFPGKQLRRLKIPPVRQKDVQSKKLLLVKMRPKMKDNIVKIGLGIGIANLKNCKQWFEYQHLLLLRDKWRSTFLSGF
jgi:hypothetical protein